MKFISRRDRKLLPPIAIARAQRRREQLLKIFSATDDVLEQTRARPKVFSGDKKNENRNVLQALVEDFQGCCAFCETETKSLSIFQFRPSMNAEPIRAEDRGRSHLYYVWLAEAWQNLYPICEDCRPAEVAVFPVFGERESLPDKDAVRKYVLSNDGWWEGYPLKEKCVFLDPCYDSDIAAHLDFTLNGTIRWITERGEATIAHFRLNRGPLVEQRRSVFASLIEHVGKHLDARSKSAEDWMPSVGPHSGAAALVLRKLVLKALDRKRSPSDLFKLINRLSALPNGKQRFDRAVQEMRAQDEPRPAREPIKYARFDGPVVSKLDSVSIENFKSIESLEFSIPDVASQIDEMEEEKGVAPVPSLLILGENAIGKSTILEAIALALVSDEVRGLLPKEEVTANELILNPKYLGAPKGERPILSNITVLFDGEFERRISIRLSQGTEEEFEATAPAPNIPVFAYGAFRHFKDVERRTKIDRHVLSLFRSDYLLANPEQWLSELEPHDFSMVARALREIFGVSSDPDKGADAASDVLIRHPELGVVVSSIADAGSPGNRSEIEIFTPLKIVSSGFRSVIALACDIIFGLMSDETNKGFQSLEEARAIVLIDEIEAHLHPRWKMSIMDGLRRALPKVTFIVTSHDPLCLRGMRSNEVLVLQRVSESTKTPAELPFTTHVFDDLPNNQNWTIEQLLLADFFQLRSTESVEADRARARMEDLLARGETPDSTPELRRYLSQFTEDLPIGDTDVHRLLQNAMADYIREKKNATEEATADARRKAHTKMLEILRRYDDPGQTDA